MHADLDYDRAVLGGDSAATPCPGVRDGWYIVGGMSLGPPTGAQDLCHHIERDQDGDGRLIID